LDKVLLSKGQRTLFPGAPDPHPGRESRSGCPGQPVLEGHRPAVPVVSSL